MPDAMASSKDRPQEIDSEDWPQGADSSGQSQEVDSEDRSPEVDSGERSKEVEVACPHCDRPTAVAVSDPQTELRVRPYVAAFGEYSTARCSDGHEFWIYYC